MVVGLGFYVLSICLLGFDPVPGNTGVKPSEPSAVPVTDVQQTVDREDGYWVSDWVSDWVSAATLGYVDSDFALSPSTLLQTGYVTAALRQGEWQEPGYRSTALQHGDWQELVLSRAGLDAHDSDAGELLEYLLYRAENPYCLITLELRHLEQLVFPDGVESKAVMQLKRLIQGHPRWTTTTTDLSFREWYLIVQDDSPDPLPYIDGEVLDALSVFIRVSDRCAITPTGSPARLQNLLTTGTPARITTEQRVQSNWPWPAGYHNGNYAGAMYRYQDRYTIESNHYSAHLSRSRLPGEPFSAPVKTGFQTMHLSISSGNWYVIAGDYSLHAGNGLSTSRSVMSRTTRSMHRLPGATVSVRPYRSGSQGRFYRGGATMWDNGTLQALGYFSVRRLSATEVWNEEALAGYRLPGWTSFRRTDGERARYHNVQLQSWGSELGFRQQIGWISSEVRVGISTHRFSDDIIPRQGLGYRGHFGGNRLDAWSGSVRVQVRQLEGMSEWSGSFQGGRAVVHGGRWQWGRVESGGWFRHFDVDHVSFFAGSVGALSGVANERGWGAWVLMRPARRMRVHGFADRYRAVGARPDTDAGLWGWERGAAADVRVAPRAVFRGEVISRGVWRGMEWRDDWDRVERIRLLQQRVSVRASVRVESGSGWMWQVRGALQMASEPGAAQLLGSGLTQSLHGATFTGDDLVAGSGLVTGHRLSKTISEQGTIWQRGTGLSQVVRYRSARWEVVFQQVVFSTDGHDSRVFAYEYDLHHVVRIPSFSGGGFRYSGVVEYRPFMTHLERRSSASGSTGNHHSGRIGLQQMLVRAKVGRTQYTDRFAIGSGNDLTEGPVRSDFGIQVIARFR